MLKRRFELSFNFLATLAGLLALLVVFTLMRMHIVDFTKVNKNFFGVTHLLIKLDFTLRNGISVLNDELITSYLQTIYSLEWDSYALAVQQEKAAQLTLLDRNLKSTLLTNDVIEFYLARSTRIKSRLRSVFNEFMANEFIKDLGDDQIERLYDNKTRVKVDIFRIPMNPTDFVRDFFTRSKVSVDYMTRIRPFVANKEPPFALDPALKTDLDYFLKKALELINNSFEGVFDSMSNLMTYVIEATISKQELTFRRTLWLYCYVLVFCLLGYLTFCIVQSVLLNRKLFRIMTIFRLLKQQDIDLLKDINEQNLSVLASNKFNEVALVQGYLDNTLLSQTAANKPLQKTKASGFSNKQKIGGFYRRHHGAERIKDDKYFGVSKMMFAFNLLIVIALTLLLILMMNIGLDMITTIEIEKLYHENYLKFIPVSNNYLSFINLLIFGNYVKIDGKWGGLQLPKRNTIQRHLQPAELGQQLPGDGEADLPELHPCPQRPDRHPHIRRLRDRGQAAGDKAEPEALVSGQVERRDLAVAQHGLLLLDRLPEAAAGARGCGRPADPAAVQFDGPDAHEHLQRHPRQRGFEAADDLPVHGRGARRLRGVLCSLLAQRHAHLLRELPLHLACGALQNSQPRPSVRPLLLRQAEVSLDCAAEAPQK